MNETTVESGGLDPARAASLRSIGLVSYVLHTIVAVGALLPGV